KFGVTEKPTTTPRKDIFAFVEKEMLEAIPSLSGDVTAATYGRPTKFVAYTLLAKLYLNAEVYTGTKRFDDAVKMCDNVMSSKKYALESNFAKIFDIDNGPQNKEIIFAVPFDNISGGQFLARYYLHRAMRAKYELPFTPSGAISVQEEFLSNFDEENDVRAKLLLKGKQYLSNGSAIIVKTSKKGFDQDYKDADGAAAIDYHLELVPKLEYRNVAAFDLGNDEKAWAQGYRYIKFSPDKTSTTRNQGNDFTFFRYADVVLMKAEAIMRGAAATAGDTPLALVNSIRKIRNASELKELNFDVMLAERGREFCNENWRRNDLIRFGKFEGKWGLKTDSDPNKRLFPIPRSILNINPKLTQNPGY
nr:RagB/SusD family nutrient uptake outer membrane protein [Leadbetterella sp.]